MFLVNPFETFSRIDENGFGPNWPMGPIFYTLLKANVPVSLNNKFHVNTVETYCKINEKPTLDLILAVFGSQRIHKYDPRGPYSAHFEK